MGARCSRGHENHGRNDVEISVVPAQVKLPDCNYKPILKEESNNSPENGVGENSHSNCFFLNAKNLSITWVEDERYWRWSEIEETSNNTVVSVAELLDVCWLDVRGKFDTAKLSRGATYEVAFVMMLKDTAYGWEVPVDVSLILPNGNKQNRKENLMKRPRGEWIEIQAGKFVASPDMAGEMELSLHEHGGHWKSGLVIKGIAIRPQY